jgi:two-component system, OmpR family, phosphate regulon sensor histidine kinase PhoR
LSKHLFLVHRKDLANFRESVAPAEANILLKPATRATLSAFLGLAAASNHAATSTVDCLRADRDEAFQCLLQTNLKLQEYDQDRTNFLARAVHDFRAPLTALTGYSGLLLDEALGPLADVQKDVLTRMQHSAKRLSRMASAMFHLSVGRHIKSRPDLRQADLSDCIQQALHEIGPAAGAKQITVSVDMELQPGGLLLEPNLIEQVLINLLDNGSKFTPKGGEIIIRGYPFFWERRVFHNFALKMSERRRQACYKPNVYRVDILDSGPAIHPERLEKIFEEYTSYSGGPDRSGGGLGLAICKMIITQHEGAIWAENRDEGPAFCLVLPLAAKVTSIEDNNIYNNSFTNLEVRE